MAVNLKKISKFVAIAFCMALAYLAFAFAIETAKVHPIVDERSQ